MLFNLTLLERGTVDERILLSFLLHPSIELFKMLCHSVSIRLHGPQRRLISETRRETQRESEKEREIDREREREIDREREREREQYL